MAALDGVRAFAVLVVIAFHAGALDAGWLGVEVFFVLSGYLITTIVIGEVGRSGTVAMGAFWGRRVRRLWPAICVYLLVTLTVIAPHWLAVTPPTIEHLVATLTWHENWRMILDGGYGAGFHAGVVRHFWSLSIEEQFYFVWPVLVWLTARRSGARSARNIRIVAALGAIASLAVVVWGVRHGWSADRLYLGSDTRVLGLCVGAAMAGVRPTGRVAAATAGVGMVALAASCWWFGDIRHDILAGPLQMFTALSAVTIVCAAGLQRGPLVWRPVRAIGRWSFGIYLWHVPIGMVVHDHVSDAWVETLLTIVGATAVAALSYRLIEMPVRRRQRTGRPIALALTAAAIVCAVIGVIEIQPGEDELLADQQTQLEPDSSTLPVDPTLPRLVVVGDSVPYLAAPSIQAAGASHGYGTVVDARKACVMSPDVDDQLLADCAPWVESLAQPTATADVVVIWWGGTGAFLRWYGVNYAYCETPEIVDEMYGAMVDVIDANDPRVIVVLPSERTDQGADGRAGTACERDAIVAWAAANGVEVFDPDPARLAAGSEREVRTDGLHYTALGAKAVSAALFDAIGNAG